jgi:hypothetical protein
VIDTGGTMRETEAQVRMAWKQIKLFCNCSGGTHFYA